MNLQYRHAGLPENIYPRKFRGGDILNACILLLVWIYCLKKKTKQNRTTKNN